MASVSSPDIARWYVLNFIAESFRDSAQKGVDRFNSINGTALRLFAPTYVVREERQGVMRFKEVALAFHYVFVFGAFAEVKRLCAGSNGFSFLIDHGSDDRYATIADDRMVHFMNIARAYKNCLPYFPIEDIDLEDGDLVEVVKGDFPGLVGTFIPKPKGKTGNIVLSIFNKVGTVAFDVKVSDIRVLEFSKRSTRANDRLDAFVPYLLKALRVYDVGEPLPVALAAKLAMFCGRMESVRLDTRKLDARLRILLYAANLIIGNSAAAASALERYEKIKDVVTNEWTLATGDLIIAVTTGKKECLGACYDRLKVIGAVSKSQRMVMEEYTHYLNP